MRILAEEDGEHEQEEDESMDDAEGSLPSLGKRRSTDAALSGQTASKRAKPGSLTEVSICAWSLKCHLVPIMTQLPAVLLRHQLCLRAAAQELRLPLDTAVPVTTPTV